LFNMYVELLAAAIVWFLKSQQLILSFIRYVESFEIDILTGTVQTLNQISSLAQKLVTAFTLVYSEALNRTWIASLIYVIIWHA
jgi:hypothetical protein